MNIMKITLKNFRHHIILVLVFSLSLVLTFVIRQIINNASVMIGEHPLLDVWLRIILILFVVLLISSLKWIKDETLKSVIVVGLLSVFLQQ